MIINSPPRPSRRCAALCALALSIVSTLSACQDRAPAQEQPPDLAATAPDTVVVRIGPFELAPGKETTRCITAKLPTTQPIDVITISTQQQLSHHVIFYRENLDRPEAPLADCQPLNLIGGGTRAPLYIGENNRAEESDLRLPPGVGYHLEANHPYTIEGHFFNASPTAKQAYADVILKLAPTGATVQQADMIFISALSSLNKTYDAMKPGIPPMQTLTIDPAFQAIPANLQDAQVFALTTHQHQFGIRAEVGKSTTVTSTGTSLLVNTDWEHPTLAHFDPPLRFAPGEGLRFACTYTNSTTSYIKFGDSAKTDEMCIVWAYYYPARGFRVYTL